MVELKVVKRTEPKLLINMANHYSKPKGFVGRNICYEVLYDGIYYGHIVGGSATLHLKGRHEFFGTSKTELNHIVNNIFFHIEKVQGKYPCRNFSTKVIKAFREKIQNDWFDKYKNNVIGFETLVELPRTGECYLRDNWVNVATTVGYTCKRTSGKGTDDWSGKRVWDVDNLKPKLIFCRKT